MNGCSGVGTVHESECTLKGVECGDAVVWRCVGARLCGDVVCASTSANVFGAAKWQRRAMCVRNRFRIVSVTRKHVSHSFRLLEKTEFVMFRFKIRSATFPVPREQPS